MWSYTRKSEFVRIAFTGVVTVDDAYAAAAFLRDDVGTTPVRLVVEVKGIDFAEKCVWVLLAVLEDAPVVDVLVLGASASAKTSFLIVGATLAVPVSFYTTALEWLMTEREKQSIRPRAPSPLLSLTIS